MGKTRYKKLIELMTELKLKYSNPITFEILKKETMAKIGCDRKQTLIPTFKDMRELNLIEEKEDGIYIK